MYHSKRTRQNLFNLNKNAKHHNIKARNKQRIEYIKQSEKKFVSLFQDIISGCEYNEFKIDSKIHYNKFDYVRVIPKGKKGYVWFQSKHNYNSCINPVFYFEKNRNRLGFVDNGTQFTICCDVDTIGCGDNGTILYGTFLNHNNTNYFNVENIYYYKNKNVSKHSWNQKFFILNELFRDYVKQISYNRNDMILLHCLTHKIPYDVVSLRKQVPYNIYCTQYLSSNPSKISFKVETDTKYSIPEKTYNIRASLNHDDYDIYDIKTQKYIGKLHVPDFKTSVYLNGIFRNIRENVDLDLLEESDTEEDFQDISLDKYVNLKHSKNMTCAFDNDMQLWKLKRTNK
jgi:hypothetical protein